LPFGTALNTESTGETNRRFTSYDRSTTTKLDYAVNRHYDPQQGRFTQVDPAGMNVVNLTSPQTLNLYAYCTNDPINQVDPSGLGFFSFLSKVFNVIGKILRIAAVVVAAFLIFVAFSLVGVPEAGALIAKALIEAGLCADLCPRTTQDQCRRRNPCGHLHYETTDNFQPLGDGRTQDTDASSRHTGRN